MFYSTRSKLILSFLGVAVLVCGIALLVGGQLLYRTILKEATNRVRLDLNAAREIYLTRIKSVRIALNLTSTGPAFLSATQKRDSAKLLARLNDVARQSELDFMGVVDKDGKTICRIGPNSMPGANDPPNPIADLIIQKHIGLSGTVILDSRFLLIENPELAERARIRLLPTKMAAPKTESEELSGMALAAAVPMYEGGNFIGVIYGGVLLNQSPEIVDLVRDTVFQHEMYNGRSIGTATIFLKNIRISTNVLDPDGSRAHRNLCLRTGDPARANRRQAVDRPGVRRERLVHHVLRTHRRHLRPADRNALRGRPGSKVCG